jgi:MFS family permease
MRPVTLLSLTFAVAMFGYSMAEKFFAFFTSAYLSQLEISAVMFAVYFFFALNSVFCGHFVEYYGTALSMKIGILLYVPFLCALLATQSFPLLFFTGALVGIGAALFWNSGTSYVLGAPGKRGRSSAVYTGTTRIGGALSAVVGGAVAAFAFYQPVLVIGIISLLAAFAMMFLLHERRPGSRYCLSEALGFFKHRHLLGYSSLAFVVSLFGGLSVSSVPLIIAGMGGTVIDVGIFWFLTIAFAVAVAFKVGSLSDRIGRKPGLYVSFAMLAACGLLTAVAESTLVIFAVAIIYSVANLLGIVLVRAAVSDIYNEKMALANAVTQCFGSLGVAAGALMPGVMSGRLSYLIAAAVFASFLLVVHRLPAK